MSMIPGFPDQPEQEIPWQIRAPDTPPTRSEEPDPLGGLEELSPLATDEEVRSYIREHYGYMAAFLDDPELGPVLIKAAREGLDSQRLYGRVSQTRWWQSRSAAQRTWEQLQAEDPAELNRMVKQTAALVRNRAGRLGLPVDVAGLAFQATKNGLTEAEQIDALIKQTNWSTVQYGDLTANRDMILEAANKYFVDVSLETAQTWAERIASDEMTMAGVNSAFKNQAKKRFTWMAEELEAGMTVEDYLAPVRNRVANELEMNPNAIDIRDQKWLSLMEVEDNGERRSATMYEAVQAARALPEWQETSNAQETATTALRSFGRVFGRTGT